MGERGGRWGALGEGVARVAACAGEARTMGARQVRVRQPGSANQRMLPRGLKSKFAEACELRLTFRWKDIETTCRLYITLLSRRHIPILSRPPSRRKKKKHFLRLQLYTRLETRVIVSP